MGNGKRRGRLAIGIVVALNKAVGGVEVGDPALIRAVEEGWMLLNNEALFRGLERSRFGGNPPGVGIGTSDRTVGFNTTSAVNRVTPASHSASPLTDGESGPVGLLRGCGKKSESQSDKESGRSNP